MNERALRISPKDRRAHEPILSRYTSLTELAQGEMTVVYRALPRAFAGQARPVVLKCLKPQFARRPECRELLRHEAWVSSQLHHAHLTRCLEVIETADFCGVVQNYVEGQNLAQLCEATEGMEAERYLVPLLVDVLEGLQALHTALDDQSWPLLLLHGAVTARHVLVGVDGMARLTDFSQARSRRGQLFNYPEHHSQAQHMAPEQVLDPESVDHRSEVFLVGVMLWEGLTGRKLFAAESEEATSQHLLRRPVLPPSKVGLRPVSALDAVCLRALSRDPDARYDSALDMACALREAAQGAELFASRAEICAWVRSVVGPHTISSRGFVSQRDDEPTTPFSRTPHSGTHQVIRAAGSRRLR